MLWRKYMNSTRITKFLNSKVFPFILLHIILFVYSLGGICSKLASQQEFMSFKFILFYGFVLINMAVYAVLWQQVLKRMPLTTAFSNKAITIVWGILWGVMFFNESITVGKIVGCILIIIGLIVTVTGDE